MEQLLVLYRVRRAICFHILYQILRHPLISVSFKLAARHPELTIDCRYVDEMGNFEGQAIYRGGAFDEGASWCREPAEEPDDETGLLNSSNGPARNMLNGASNMTMDPPTTPPMNEPLVPRRHGPTGIGRRALRNKRNLGSRRGILCARCTVHPCPNSPELLEPVGQALEAERQANDNATVSIWREVLRGQAISDARQMTSDQFAALMLRDAVARERKDGG